MMEDITFEGAKSRFIEASKAYIDEAMQYHNNYRGLSIATTGEEPDFFWYEWAEASINKVKDHFISLNVQDEDSVILERAAFIGFKSVEAIDSILAAMLALSKKADFFYAMGQKMRAIQKIEKVLMMSIGGDDIE